MKQKSDSIKAKANEPILDFISDKTQTLAAKRLTRSIVSLHSLWQLAKMSRIVKKNTED